MVQISRVDYFLYVELSRYGLRKKLHVFLCETSIVNMQFGICQ